MRRGEIWTVAAAGDYTGKPHPAVLLQDDAFAATASVTICAFTSDPIDVPFLRILVEPNERNGLHQPSRLMVDKITTVPRARLGQKIGQLDEDDLSRLSRAAIVFLGLAGNNRTSAD
jgi:mRNA interferase MazF